MVAFSAIVSVFAPVTILPPPIKSSVSVIVWLLPRLTRALLINCTDLKEPVPERLVASLVKNNGLALISPSFKMELAFIWIEVDELISAPLSTMIDPPSANAGALWIS